MVRFPLYLTMCGVIFGLELTGAEGTEDSTNRSMPDLNRIGRPSHLLPGPEANVTLREYEIEEPPV